MEGIEEGQEGNFAVPTQDPVATTAPTPKRKLVKFKKFNKEYELPFTQEEIDELGLIRDTPEEKKVLDYLKDNIFKKTSTLTFDEINKFIQDIPEKLLKKVINQVRIDSPEFKDSQSQKNHHHLITKLLDKYETYEKAEKLAQKEEERLDKERKFIDATLDKILTEGESAAKQHLKGLSKEERETFNNSYKARIGEMYKTKPNVEALIESTSKKVKDVFDKAVLEKSKQDKLAKEEEAKKKALLPPQATAVQPTQQRTLSRGRSLVRSKSATKTETLGEEPKRVQVAETSRKDAPKREEQLPNDLRSAYKELRKEVQRIAEDDAGTQNLGLFKRNTAEKLKSKIPLEVQIEDQLDLPTLEQINEAIDKKDLNKLKEYVSDFETVPFSFGNKQVASLLKILTEREKTRFDFSSENRQRKQEDFESFIESNPSKIESIKTRLKNTLPNVESSLLYKLERDPKLKEAYERVVKKREEALQAQAIPEETRTQTPQSLVSALSRTHQEEAEYDEDEAYQEDLRRATRESLLDQEEQARNRSGKRGVIPATTLETTRDQEIDEEAFQEAAKNYPGDVIPKPERRAQTVLPEEIPSKDAEGNPMDMASYIQSAALKALYDFTNSNMQNPPKKEAFYGEEAPSILANELRRDYAQHGNPLSDQYRARMNDLAELMVKDQLIDQAAKILQNSPNETDREQARNFLLDRKMVNEAASRITSSPTFKDDIKRFIDDSTYESQAADLLKPNTEYEKNAADTLGELPDLTPDINFELTPEEKALHEANVKSFIEQATRNFERTDLRRSKNKYSGRNVWNSGLAAQERNEVWQDFNRHLADKQLQMLNEARQQSFLKKKELHEQKVKHAAALLQKSRAWLDTNVLKNRNQTEMANALSGLQGLNLQRAKEYSQFESVLNAGRHGDMQALAALQMTQQEAAQQFERMQHQKEQTTIQRATGLSNVGGQHAGQIINASNSYGNMAAMEDQNLANRVEAGLAAGETIKQAKQKRDAWERQNEAQSRNFIGQNLNNLQNAAQSALGQPTQEPTYSFNPHSKPEHIPGNAPPIDNTFTNLAGLGLSAIGTIGNYQNQALANKALEAQTRLYNAQSNQISQIPVEGGKK